MNTLLTRKLKEYRVQNTMILETIKTIRGSKSTAQSAYEAGRKYNNHATWLKLCYPNV